jgi:hypothetical protein
MVKLRKKITLIKGKKIKIMRNKLKKIYTINLD